MAGVVLRERDIEALDHFLEVMAEPRPVAEFQRRTVENIPLVVPSEVTAWNEVDPATGVMANPVIYPAPPDWQMARETELRRVFAEYAHQQPLLQHQIRTGDGRPHTISDFYTQERFHQTELYQQHYAFLGTEDQLAIRLPAPYLVVAITITRGWQEFTPRDRLLMNLMRPQIVQGLRNAQAFDRMARLLASVEQHLETAGEGLMLLNEGNEVEYASPNAAQILTNWMGEWKGVALPATLGEWILDGPGDSRAVPARGPRPPAPPWPLILQRQRRQLTIRRIPKPDEGGVALVVTERALDVSVATMLARLGLTPRQAEVLELAIQGSTNARIAAELHITTDTVESHMTLALGRLGVESRTAAANLIFQAINDTDRPADPPG